MIVLVFLFAAVGILIPTLEKQIKKRAPIWYGAALAVSVCSLVYLILGRGMPGYSLVMAIFGRGELATVLFVYVMLAPVLPEKRKLTLAVYRIRGELAILAAFLIWPHNAYFGRMYVVSMMRNPGSMSAAMFAAAVCSVLMLVLLVPLTVTSFKRVRKKMKAKRWKQLQRFSYLFYGLIYLHILLVLGPHVARSGEYAVKMLFYTVLFGGYATLRVRKYLAVKRKVSALVWRRVETGGFLVTAMACVLLIGAGFGPEEEERSVIAETSTAVTESAALEGTSAAAAETMALAETGVSATEIVASAETAALETADVEEGGEAGTQEGAWKDGVWEGEGKGFLGTVRVEVTVAGGRIEEVKVTGYEDDPDYFVSAGAKIPKAVVEAQSTQVDAVSGATYSSKGILEAVEDALEKAR
ncbi:MAG: FMN-binding protein [Eubacteriales bacterium]|nr:FMN-binding protein [Eubacteriales bacterium]